MKRRIIFIIIFILIGYGILYYYQHKPKKVSNILQLYGNVEIRQVDMGFRVEGKIQKLYYEEGDFVKKGAILASLDSTSYRANYAKSLAEIKLNRQINANASRKLMRNLSLCQEGTVPKQDCDNYKSERDTSSSAIEASVASSRVAKKNLSDSKIYAPSDGIITTRVKEEGSVVAQDETVYTLAKMKPVWIRTFISEKDLGNISYNMKAKVLTDSVNPKTGKNREYVGYIGYISPVAEFTPKTVQTEDLRTDLVYRIRVYVYNLDEYLRQGMPVSIVINLKGKSKNGKYYSSKKSY